MNTASAILATLSDSGPADITELCRTLAATEPSAAREHVCQELHGLIRQDRVKVDCGIYQLKENEMGTISKEIADDVIAGKYEDDRPVKIVKYTNKWGGEAYGLVCAHEHPDRYAASEFVINPTMYWEHP